MSCPDWRLLDPAAAEPFDAAGSPAWQRALAHLDTGCARCWREALAVDPALIFRRLPAPELAPAQEAEEVEAARAAVAAMRAASRLDGDHRVHRVHRRGGLAASLGTGLGRAKLGGRRGAEGAPPRVAGGARPAPRRIPVLSAPATRWAVAAGLTAMALVYGAGHGWRRPHAGSIANIAASAASGAAVSGAADGAAGVMDPSVQALQGPGSIRSLESLHARHSLQLPLTTPSYAAAAGGPGWTGAAGAQPASSRPSIEGLSRPEARVYQIDGPHLSVVMIVDDKLDV